VDTKPCKHCSHPVAFDAKACPSCGGQHPYPMSLVETVYLAGGWSLGVGLALGAIWGAFYLLRWLGAY
jgi:hypothetical protein